MRELAQLPIPAIAILIVSGLPLILVLLIEVEFAGRLLFTERQAILVSKVVILRYSEGSGSFAEEARLAGKPPAKQFTAIPRGYYELSRRLL